MKFHRNLLALALTALVLTVAGVATAATAAKGHRPKAPRVLAAAVHADVKAIFADRTTKSETWDKGEVSKISSSSITLKRKDGVSVDLAIDANTKVRARDGKIEVGAHAFAISQNGKALAILVAKPRGDRDNKHRGRGRPGPGHLAARAVHVDWALVMPDGKALSLSLDKGDVTAASSSSFTLKRKDGESVNLSIDSSTKVRKREHAALAVGDKALAWSQSGKALVVFAGQPKQS